MAGHFATLKSTGPWWAAFPSRAGCLFAILVAACLTGCMSNRQSAHETVELPQPVYDARPAWVDSLPLATTPGTTPATVPQRQAGTDGGAVLTRPLASLRDPRKTLEAQPADLPARAASELMGEGGVLSEVPPAGADFSRLERLYHEAGGLSRGKGLRQFGYEAFATRESVEQTGTVAPSYVIGPGDQILLQLSGAVERESALEVQRDGTVFLPETGPIAIAGAAARELVAKLDAAIGAKLKGVQVNASLGSLHSIRVTVVGRVQQPGALFASANATVLGVLSQAGGPTHDGTLRRVVLKRAGQADEVLDLYQLLADGNAAVDRVLLAGDLIQVGPIGPTAAIVGPAGEGIFELADGVTVAQLAQLAGGTNAFTRATGLRLERSDAQGGRSMQTLDLQVGAGTVLRDGDVVQFDTLAGAESTTVALAGQVLMPGIYPWREGLTVADLLRQGGGYLVGAATDQALLERRFGDPAVYSQTLRDSSLKVQDELIWVDLEAVLAGDAKANLPLRRLDRLWILARTDRQEDPTVSISGAVRKAGTYRLTAGLTLHDLLRLAGGPTSDAFGGESTIVRRQLSPDQRHFDVALHQFQLAGVMQGAADEALQNRDQVVVRRVQTLQVRAGIDGQVRFPGTYVLPQGSRISDLVAMAGGLLPDADLRGASFTRESIREMQQLRLNEMFEETRQQFARNRDEITRDGRVNESVASHLNLLGLTKIAKAAKDFQARGRVVLNFCADDFPGSPDDLALESGDQLTVPQRNPTVVVLGHVFSPNAFLWREPMTVADYLAQSGGMKELANRDQTYLVMASGEVRSAAQIGYSKLLAFRPGPGDTILVPVRELDRSSHAQISDTLSLVRQLVEIGLIGATVPNAGNRNAAVGLDLGTSPQPIPTSVGRPYDEVLEDERVRERENR